MTEMVTIDFHGATLIAQKCEDEASTVILAEGMGLRWQARRRR